MTMHLNTSRQTSDFRLARANFVNVILEFAEADFKVGISGQPVRRVWNLGQVPDSLLADYFRKPRVVGKMNRSYRSLDPRRLFILFETPSQLAVRTAERDLISLGRRYAKDRCVNINPGGEGRLPATGHYYVYLALGMSK